jgi:hypothetical protein
VDKLTLVLDFVCCRNHYNRGTQSLPCLRALGRITTMDFRVITSGIFEKQPTFPRQGRAFKLLRTLVPAGAAEAYVRKNIML